MVGYIITVSVNFCGTPSLGSVNTSLHGVRRQVVIDTSAHIILDVFITERKSAESPFDRSTFDCSTMGMRHHGTFCCAVAPIIANQVPVFICTRCAPRLAVSNICTSLIHLKKIPFFEIVTKYVVGLTYNAPVDKRKDAVLVFAVEFRSHAKAILVRFYKPFVMSSRHMLWSGVRIDSVVQFRPSCVHHF